MTGSALPLIRAVSLLFTVLCLVIVLVTMRANGVLVLGTISAAAFCWSCGMFTRDFWISDSPEYARVDAELDAAERDFLAPVPASSAAARAGRLTPLVRVSAPGMVWIIVGGALAVTAVVGLVVGAVLS